MPKRRSRTQRIVGQRKHFGPLLAELRQLNKALAEVNSRFSADAKEDPDKKIIKDKNVDDTPLDVRRCRLCAYLGENELPIEWQVEWSAPTWFKLITSLGNRYYNRATFPSMTYRQGQNTHEIPWLAIQKLEGRLWEARPKNPNMRGGLGSTGPETCFMAWPKASELGTRDLSQEDLNRLIYDKGQRVVDEDGERVLFWWRMDLFSNVKFRCYHYSYDEKKNPAGEDDARSYWYFPGRYMPEFKRNLQEQIVKYGISSDVYGRIWDLKFPKPPSRISKELLTFITAQTEPSSEINGAWLLYYYRGEYPNVALKYAAPWPRTRVYYNHLSSGVLLIQYHIRFLKICTPIDLGRSGSLASENESELELSRSVWQEDIAFLNSKEKLCLCEVRNSIALNTELYHEEPLFTIVTLQDLEEEYYSWDTHLSLRMESDIQGSGMAAGISAFQYIISVYLRRWNGSWNDTLDHIDEIHSVEVGDALSQRWIMDNLFDGSFDMSARYLAVLQLLRIFTVSITETDGDIDILSSRLLSSICFALESKDALGTLKTRNLIRKNFEILDGEKKKLVGQLLERVKNKTSEIESLRDGIFNATNLREAAMSTKEAVKSSEMNSYLFIFTVMTIFYLPLSFVTSLFGMHLFDKPDLSSNQTSFYITIVLPSAVTYIAALGAVWAVAPDEQREKVKDRWRRTVERRRQETNEDEDSSYTSGTTQQDV